jgi:transposase
MIRTLVASQSPQEALAFVRRRLKAPREELFDALPGDITENHRFVRRELLQHIEARIARFDAYRLAQREGEHSILALLQTIPGIDLIGTALRIVEIGADMSVFGRADRLASWVGLCPGHHEKRGVYGSKNRRRPPVAPTIRCNHIYRNDINK